MLDITFLHGNRPIWSIAAYRCRYLERARQLCVHHDFACLIKVMGKITLTNAVGNDIIGNVLRCLISLVKFRFTRCSKDVRVISAIGEMVMDIRLRADWRGSIQSTAALSSSAPHRQEYTQAEATRQSSTGRVPIGRRRRRASRCAAPSPRDTVHPSYLSRPISDVQASP